MNGYRARPKSSDLLIGCIVALLTPQAGAQSVFVNELHYDNAGTDAGEAIEIAGPAGTDLSGCSVVLYNGSTGAVYNTTALASVIPDQQNGFGTVTVSYGTNGIQNGGPDGIALTGSAGVIQFLSYEGAFTAVDGPASGLASTDIGVAESGDTAAGESLQLGGTGAAAGDFTWAGPTAGSFGAVNAGQVFSGEPASGNPCGSGDPVPVGPFEIWEIQGDGAASPFAGRLIQSVDNVVIAVGPDGFFMQTPAARSDGDVDTSDGIFVFTGGAPAVSVGDQVDVTGQVQEFFDFTEFGGGPVVTVDASGLPLPVAVAFDETVPSRDPAAPSCALEYECYEGMRVSITGGTVTGSNQHFGSDPIAEVHVTAAGARAFREPGVEFPGIPGMPGIPVWDGNPELFELDPDKLGLPNVIIPAGSHFDATGALGFEFGGYELWPVSLSVTELPIPRPVRARDAREFTVGSLNLFRQFDDVNDPPDTNAVGEPRDDEVVPSDEYAVRRAKFVTYILEVLGAPDILAVQEAEKLGVLEDLAAGIQAANPGVSYTAYLQEGNDIGTIDVGFLVRDTVAVDAVTQLGRDEIFAFDGSPLHDRPPLLLEGRVTAGADFAIKVMAVHNRSLGGVEDPGSEGERVRLKRLTQAQSIAARVQQMQADDPDLRLVIVGDFNAFEFTDGLVDAVGQIKGDFDPDRNLLSGPDLVDPNLVDQVLAIGPNERYSFIFDGSAQVLDHALTSRALDGAVRGLEFGRGNADAAEVLIEDATTPLRSSDHDGLVLFLTTDRDADGVNDDGDFCPGTVIPEAVPTRGLGVNRQALTDGDFAFDTTGPRAGGDNYTTDDTAGCSCAQIIEAQGLDDGHAKFGCSNGAMKNWVELVTLRNQ